MSEPAVVAVLAVPSQPVVATIRLVERVDRPPAQHLVAWAACQCARYQPNTFTVTDGLPVRRQRRPRLVLLLHERGRVVFWLAVITVMFTEWRFSGMVQQRVVIRVR